MIETISQFWDCECEEDYIHSKSEMYCLKCDVYKSEQPDSRTEEVQNEKE